MRRRLAALVLALALPTGAGADPALLAAAVDDHVLPRVAAAARAAEALADAARQDCAPESPTLRAAYHDGFDAWLGAAHLAFGPALAENRIFAMGFWPDPRGSGPRALAALIEAADPVAQDPSRFADVSVAARGYHALETMLYDARLAQIGEAAYRCTLVQAITADIAATASAIAEGWADGHGDALRTAGAAGNSAYPSAADGLRTLFGAVSSGLQFTSDARLGRPLGTFDKPRPKRSETWRSERSLRNVALSVAAAGDLAVILARPAETYVQDDLRLALDQFAAHAARLDDPGLQGVATVQGRIRVEALQSRLDELRASLAQDVAPAIGVAAGFNALDGD